MGLLGSALLGITDFATSIASGVGSVLEAVGGTVAGGLGFVGDVGTQFGGGDVFEFLGRLNDPDPVQQQTRQIATSGGGFFPTAGFASFGGLAEGTRLGDSINRALGLDPGRTFQTPGDTMGLFVSSPVFGLTESSVGFGRTLVAVA